MKYLGLVIALLIFSCGKEEKIMLPKAAKTIVSDVKDHSPIYIFFRTKGIDTLAEVNRKNSIITTNWILNIDARLSLKLVIPEVMKLQDKKRKEKAHKHEKAQNYYAYADTIGKNMAFIAFTKVFYNVRKPLNGGIIIYFKKGSDSAIIDNQIIKKENILEYMYSANYAVNPPILLLFDMNMSFGEYLQNKIIIKELDTFYNEVPQEFIF